MTLFSPFFFFLDVICTGRIVPMRNLKSASSVRITFSSFSLFKLLMSVDTFSSAIDYWKKIQLSNLQKELDQQGLTIVENQKDGLVSRKRLAEQTRGYNDARIHE